MKTNDKLAIWNAMPVNPVAALGLEAEQLINRDNCIYRQCSIYTIVIY